jgi:TolB protein
MRPVALFVVLLLTSCAQTPAWSPLNADLIYTTRVGDNTDIVRRIATTQAVSTLTPDPAAQHWGRMSPDGSTLAFQTQVDGQWDIALQRIDSGDPMTVIVDDPAHDVLPEWSPDGSRLLFFSARGQARGLQGELRGHLYVIDVSTLLVEQVTADVLPNPFGGSWLPSGDAIVLSREFEGDIELCRLDLNTGVQTRLTSRPGDDYGAAVSPDGSQVAFHSAHGDLAHIAVLTQATGEVRELTSGAQHYDPQWSPDGRWLVFTGAPPGASQFDLFAIPATGGEIVTLVATQADERTASWPGASHR